jgi:hypothetical protein
MTKTTNYEISKKLAEIGFRAECSYFYFHSDNNNYEASSLEAFGYDKISDCDIEDKYYPAYDLETLLDALPEKIKVGIDRTSQSKFYFDKISFGYAKEPKIEFQFYCRIQKNESLADTAGRLIIELYNNNLIKF